MDGSLEVKSDGPEKGSQFTLTVNLDHVEVPTAIAQLEPTTSASTDESEVGRRRTMKNRYFVDDKNTRLAIATDKLTEHLLCKTKILILCHNEKEASALSSQLHYLGASEANVIAWNNNDYDGVLRQIKKLLPGVSTATAPSMDQIAEENGPVPQPVPASLPVRVTEVFDAVVCEDGFLDLLVSRCGGQSEIPANAITLLREIAEHLSDDRTRMVFLPCPNEGISIATQQDWAQFFEESLNQLKSTEVQRPVTTSSLVEAVLSWSPQSMMSSFYVPTVVHGVEEQQSSSMGSIQASTETAVLQLDSMASSATVRSRRQTAETTFEGGSGSESVVWTSTMDPLQRSTALLLKAQVKENASSQQSRGQSQSFWDKRGEQEIRDPSQFKAAEATILVATADARHRQLLVHDLKAIYGAVVDAENEGDLLMKWRASVVEHKGVDNPALIFKYHVIVVSDTIYRVLSALNVSLPDIFPNSARLILHSSSKEASMMPYFWVLMSCYWTGKKMEKIFFSYFFSLIRFSFLPSVFFFFPILGQHERVSGTDTYAYFSKESS